MKQHLNLILLLMWLPTLSMAQIEYTSKEKEEYYKNREFKEFEPLDEVSIANYHDDFFEFVKLDSFVPYGDTIYFTPYQDSIFRAWRPNQNYGIIPQPVKGTGKIDNSRILKHDKKGNVEAFVYESSAYEDTYYVGIWIAYSEDSGNTWSYYYTGITQKQPLFIKWYSSHPLINEQGDIQIEACLVRQKSPLFHPLSMESYQIVKDGLLLTFDLETLCKDSDSDGLTDIVEAKFRTDPNNADTDNDGVPDNLDLNPRFAPSRTDKTIIFETIIENNDMISFEELNIPTDEKPEIHYATDETQTILIVTDDKNLQSIQPKSYRVIILTQKEYENSPRYFKNELNKMTISPLFKVDGENDTYVVNIYFNTWGSGYWAKKTEKTWTIKETFSIIE